MARAVGSDGKPIPVAELSRIMGHSKISTTQNFYVHSDEAQNKALLKSFSNPARRKIPKKDEKNKTGTDCASLSFNYCHKKNVVV